MGVELTAQVRSYSAFLRREGVVLHLHQLLYEYTILSIACMCEISTLHIDIDECELYMDNCHVNATCVDVIGSFHCTCNNGFDGDGVNCISKFM